MPLVVMLDHHQLTLQADSILQKLARRGGAMDTLAAVETQLQQRRTAIAHAEALRRALNEGSQEVQRAMRANERDKLDAQKDRMRALKTDLKAAEADMTAREQQFLDMMLALPNIPDDSVPDGSTEADNREERRFGTPKIFSNTPEDHTALGERLGLLSFEQAAKISGARFVVMRGRGAKLERALIAFMLDLAIEHGYEEIAPPLLVRPETMQAAGQYPKFIGESFETQGREYVLIPTSEVPLVGLHQGDMLAHVDLPRRYTAYTPCFRREAGSAGRDTRGLIRLHQFNKVELVSVTTPERSAAEHERLTGHAEAVLQKLELPYRVVTLCAGDLGFAAQKTYDLEVWLPASNRFREISSCSNCGDFQARRAAIRFKDDSGKARFAHTLNGSGLAVGRTLLAILENYQQDDGSVSVPTCLVPYMGGVTKIEPVWRSERDSNPR